MQIATDIGGTFTDLVGYDPATGTVVHAKSHTDPSDFTAGVARCLDKAGVDLSAAREFLHGSTVAINTAIERKGALTALFVTSGTRDVYRIGRSNRPESYNLFFERPEPYVPRHLTFEIDERMSARGEVLRPLDEESVVRAVDAARASGVEAVAICFLHSYVDPGHEQVAARIVREAAPDLFVSLSHEILREYREYERTSTTVVNAYVGPRVSRYLGRLAEILDERSYRGHVYIMQSNGGVMSPDTARLQPARTMESGPVGGAIAAARLAERLGMGHAVVFDMGGTTAKAALIRDGQPDMSDGYYVGGAVSGHPVMLPVVDVIEVGAGGGSIAAVDEVGALHVGPESAGGHPGPICYGWGGARPTVTDANAVLGRLSPSNFLGGEMPLEVERAGAAIEQEVGAPLGLDRHSAALAVVDIAVAKMALAVRAVSVERGLDPRDCALVAFGGAGPLHACAIARMLHIPTVVVPTFPGHFSALGMLLADVRHDFVRTLYRRLDEVAPEEVRAVVDEMREDATARLRAEGVAEAAIEHELSLDLRYVGQEFTLRTPLDVDELSSTVGLHAVRARFDDLHLTRFGHQALDEAVEVINARVVGVSHRQQLRVGNAVNPSGDRSAGGHREVVFSEGERAVARQCDVVSREAMGAGDEAVGPVIIEEYASTLVLDEGDKARVGDGGEIVVTIGG
ncbi:MAG: hydantoinase/oxoprolinase family protein [Acidimicrobiales bacterium]